MALATQCPHCLTTFRVAHDQLKLRAGLVRCGACKQIFNGIEHLLRPSEAVVPPETVVPLAAPPDAVSPPTSATLADAVPTPEVASPDPVSAAAADCADLYPAFDLIATSPDGAIDVAVDESVNDPLQRMTLMQFTDDNEATEVFFSGDAGLRAGQLHMPSKPIGADAAAPAESPPDEIDQAIDHLQRKPWRSKKKFLSRDHVEGPPEFDSDEDEPSFLTRARHRPRTSLDQRRWLAPVIGLLLLGALAQSAFAFRDQIAARLPATKPLLKQACVVFRCRIDFPAQTDAVSIESNELVALGQSKNTFALNLVLRNRSNVAQRWPSIELTLLDATDQPVVQRVFTEREYLPISTEAGKGFSANSEQAAKIAFELLQQKAANYRVYLFYP